MSLNQLFCTSCTHPSLSVDQEETDSGHPLLFRRFLMHRTPTHLFRFPLPPLPPLLPPKMQAMVATIERKLATTTARRQLILVHQVDMLPLLLVMIERILRLTITKRILVLTSA